MIKHYFNILFYLLAWNSVKPLTVTEPSSTNLWNTVLPEPVEQTGWANFDNFNSSFSTDISFENKSCNEAEAKLPEVPIVNENVPLSGNETVGDTNNSENKENLNKANDIDLKTEETNISSISNADCIKTSVNIPDTNANLAVVEDR